MSGRHSRDKGHGFERRVAKRIREALGHDARRGLQYRDGSDCGDVVGVPGWQIECKIGARAPIRRGILQAEGGAKDGCIPLTIWQDDRKPAYATLRFDDLLEVLKELEDLRKL